MNLLMYLVGLLYYVAVPLSLALEAEAFKPGIQEGVLGCDSGLWTVTFSRVAGWLVFLWGSWEQHRCHVILAALRGPGSKSKQEAQAKSKYGMPVEGWFRTLTSPHYSFEIVLYGGLVLLSQALCCPGFEPAEPNVESAGAMDGGRGLAMGDRKSLRYGRSRPPGDPDALSSHCATADRTHRWYRDVFGSAYTGARARVLQGVY